MHNIELLGSDSQTQVINWSDAKPGVTIIVFPTKKMPIYLNFA